MLAQYYQILKELVSIKSISGEKKYTDEIIGCATFLHGLLQEHGFVSEIIEGYGNPIVFGGFFVDKKLPTCLLYGHYDVQPAHKSEGWQHDPFSLHIGKDKIYGRGVVDNKGQFLIHLLTLFALAEERKLGYNVKIVIEGNEETGSGSFEQFMTDHRQELLADFCLISDSSLANNSPCIDAGYRGCINARLEITTAHTDLHSGEYGGIVPNAIHEMNKLLAKLYDMNHHITIPYFYYDVQEIPFDVLIKNKKIKIDMQKIMHDTGVKTFFQEKNLDLMTQIGLKPTIQVTGISGGHTGDGFKNAIPNISTAHLNFRLVKNQTISKVMGAFEQWLKTSLPIHLDYTLEYEESTAQPIKVDLENIYAKRAMTVLEKVYDAPVIQTYCGGSIPIVYMLEHILGIKQVMVPLANEDSHAHGSDENFDIAAIERGFAFSAKFFAE